MTHDVHLESEEAAAANEAILKLARMACQHGEVAANHCSECKALLPVLVEQVKTERKLDKRLRIIEEHLRSLDEQVEEVKGEFDDAFDAFQMAQGVT